MKQFIKDECLGEIAYEESVWTGKKRLSVNGEILERISKTDFRLPSGEIVVVKGNYLRGASLLLGQRTVQLTPSVKWYEIALSVLPFLLIMIWGNVVALCEIVPVVGGAIGGAISGVFSVLNLFIIKGVKPLWLKIVISAATLAITFLICFAIATAILAAVK